MLESHCGLLQLGLATAQTLRHPIMPRWDACLAFERLLLQVCAQPTHNHMNGAETQQQSGGSSAWNVLKMLTNPIYHQLALAR